MENELDARRRLADRLEVPQVTLDQLERVAVGLRQPGEVFPFPGEEVVEDPHALPGGEERPRQVRPDKPRPARHQVLHPANLLPKTGTFSELPQNWDSHETRV